jgi:hypothetical protein
MAKAMLCVRQASGEAGLEDIDAKDGSARGVDTSRHFSYYAFEGKTGVLRWKHEVRPYKHFVNLSSGSFVKITKLCHYLPCICTRILTLAPARARPVQSTACRRHL